MILFSEKIIKQMRSLESSILDIILPKTCLGCKQEGSFLCKDCCDLIEIKSWQVCPLCQKSLTDQGTICRYCKLQKPTLDSLTTACDYDAPLISKSVHSFKYKFVQELSDPLSKILIKAFIKNKLEVPDLIIPIPLHPLRFRWRGFNQSQLLANNLANNLLPGLTIKVSSKTLRRVKFTSSQASLQKSTDRQENLKNAFEIDLSTIDQIKNKKILIIDDICTTGSTLFEASKQLRQLKPKSIRALVISRQK